MLLDRTRAEQAAREDRLRPRQARRVLRARRPKRMLEAVGDRPASLLPGVGPKTVRAPAPRRDQDRGRPRQRTGRAARTRAGGSGAARRAHAGSTTAACETERERKSESCETTFAQDVSDREVMLADARSPLRAAVRGPAEGRLPRADRDAQDPAAPVPHLHALAHAGGRRPRTCRRCSAVAHELLGRVELDAPVRLLGVGVSALERVRLTMTPACSPRRRVGRVVEHGQYPLQSRKVLRPPQGDARRAAAVGIRRGGGAHHHPPPLRGRRPTGPAARRRAGAPVEGPARATSARRRSRSCGASSARWTCGS